MSKNVNIMLVHGAWADGSCWSKVTLLLQAKDYKVTAAQIPNAPRQSITLRDRARFLKPATRRDLIPSCVLRYTVE
jgi:hypothetical protein